jgi:hypothetical protein
MRHQCKSGLSRPPFSSFFRDDNLDAAKPRGDEVDHSGLACAETRWRAKRATRMVLWLVIPQSTFLDQWAVLEILAHRVHHKRNGESNQENAKSLSLRGITARDESQQAGAACFQSWSARQRRPAIDRSLVKREHVI